MPIGYTCSKSLILCVTGRPSWNFKLVQSIVKRSSLVQTRVARWYCFQTKNPVWVHFWGPQNETVGIFYGHLEYITAIWYILWSFGNLVAVWYIPPFLVYWIKKNLATLVQTLLMQLFVGKRTRVGRVCTSIANEIGKRHVLGAKKVLQHKSICSFGRNLNSVMYAYMFVFMAFLCYKNHEFRPKVIFCKIGRIVASCIHIVAVFFNFRSM
jgi:hypothetical protein